MSRRLTAVYLILGVIFAILLYCGLVTVGAQTKLGESGLVCYSGMSWTGGGVPHQATEIAITSAVPPCVLTPTEKLTLTCAFVRAGNPISSTWIDGVIVHLKGDNITSDVFRTINGGWIQMRVKQGKRYTLTVDQPAGYVPLASPLIEGLTRRHGTWVNNTFQAGKTSDLCLLQLWPR